MKILSIRADREGTLNPLGGQCSFPWSLPNAILPTWLFPRVTPSAAVEKQKALEKWWRDTSGFEEGWRPIGSKCRGGLIYRNDVQIICISPSVQPVPSELFTAWHCIICHICIPSFLHRASSGIHGCSAHPPTQYKSISNNNTLVRKVVESHSRN